MGDELDLTGNGGVLKRIIREAPTDAIVPPKGPTLADVHCKAVLPGTDGDTSEEDMKKRKREEEVVDGEYVLTQDGGVVKKIIKKAEADAIDVEDHSLVYVLYNGFVVKLETGQVLDFTFGDDTVLEDDTILVDDAISSFWIGGGSMMRGWDIALRTMKVGDIARITCKPKYAFGKEGFPPRIPPNATVISTLKLVACETWKSITPWQLAKGIKKRAAKKAEHKREKAAAAAAASAAAVAAAAAWKEKKAAAARNPKGTRTLKLDSVFKWGSTYRI